MTAYLLTAVILAMTSYSAHGYSKYGRTCADIGCPTSEVCVMAEDPCTYRSNECGSYPTCQRKANAVASCDTFVCPPTTYCRLDGNVPKCISDNGPLGGKNGNPNANIDPHNINTQNNNERPSAPLYPQIPPRGQTTTRSPAYRPNGNNGGGYQGGSIGSGYPGQPGSNGGGGYGGGSIGGGYPGGYSGSGYPGQQNPYAGYPAGYPSNNGYPTSNTNTHGGYPGSNNNAQYPYNTNPYYNSNNNNRYGHNSATTANPIFNSLKNLGLFCLLLHTLVAQMQQV